MSDIDIVGFATIFLAFVVLGVLIKYFLNGALEWGKWTCWMLLYAFLIYAVIFTIYAHYAPIDMNQMHSFLNFRDKLYTWIDPSQFALPTIWSITRFATRVAEYARST